MLRMHQRGQYILKPNLGRRVFAPSWTAGLLTLLVVPCLISLGLWQLRRADEKRDLIAHAVQGQQQTLVLTAASAPAMNRYQHVTVSGSYDSTHQVLLDNMPSSGGEPGYRVLTPLSLADRSLLLVDRGWLPMGSDRKRLPAIEVSDAARTVTGRLDELPRPGVRAGEAGVMLDRWPQVLNFPTYAELQTLYGLRLQTRILLLDAKDADGYERIRQIGFATGFGPERHVGYAIQWFGMAFTVLVIFVIVNLKRKQT